MDAQVLVQIVGIALAVEGFTEAVFKPLLLKLNIDVWWLFYIAFVIGCALGWFSGMNLFPQWFASSVTVGRIVTAAACGAGPSFLYNLADNAQPARLPNVEK
mgnify:CR=1 FL=1